MSDKLGGMISNIVSCLTPEDKASKDKEEPLMSK